MTDLPEPPTAPEQAPPAARPAVVLDWLMQRWWRVPMVSLWAAVLVGLVVFVFCPLRYTAAATFLINTDGTGALASLVGQLSSPLAALKSDSRPAARFETILQSRTVRQQVSQKAGLSKVLGLTEYRALELLSGITEFKDQPGDAVSVAVTCVGPSRLRSWVHLPGRLDTDGSKRLAADLSNGYVAALRAYMGGVSHADTEFVRARRDDVAKQLAGIEDRLQAFRTQQAAVDPAGKALVLGEASKQTEEAYVVAQADRETLRKSLVATRSRLAGEDVMRVQQEVTSRNPVINSLSEKLAAAQVDLATALEGGKKPNHPDVLGYQDTIAATKRELAAVKQDIRMQVSRAPNPAYDDLLSKAVDSEIQLVQAETRCQVYQSSLKRMALDMARLPPVVRQYEQLLRDQKMKGELLASLSQQLEASVIQEKQDAGDKLRVLDPAVPPEKKSGPSGVRSAAVTFMLVLLLLGITAIRRSGVLRLVTSDVGLAES